MAVLREHHQLVNLQAFLQDHPHISITTPSSPTYAHLREVFCLDNRQVPLAIVRPQSAADVALLVQYATSHNMKFVVRSGGHNLFGASQVEGALTIDLRDITYVRVQEGSKSAKIGGGTLQGDVASHLAVYGLAVATGTVSSVGYVGWAAYGGYGPFSANFGLGVDQLLGAKVVNGKGEIVEADETLMKGIRGAGGVFGIIVEVTVKVYPLQKVLAGAIIYDSTDITSTFEKFNAGYRSIPAVGEEFPPQLTVQQMIFNSPYGRVMALGFMWSSEEIDGGKIWLAKFEALGSVLMNTVTVTSIPDWLHASSAFVPRSIYGSARTHNLTEISSEAAEIIGKTLDQMPSDPGTMVSIHQLRGPSAETNARSVFGTRAPHFMFELVGGALTEENRAGSVEWAAATWDAIRRLCGNEVLPTTYISLDPPGEADQLSKTYDSNRGEVLRLKRAHDPLNVFDLAIPGLTEYL